MREVPKKTEYKHPLINMVITFLGNSMYIKTVPKSWIVWAHMEAQRGRWKPNGKWTACLLQDCSASWGVCSPRVLSRGFTDQGSTPVFVRTENALTNVPKAPFPLLPERDTGIKVEASLGSNLAVKERALQESRITRFHPGFLWPPFVLKVKPPNLELCWIQVVFISIKAPTWC